MSYYLININYSTLPIIKFNLLYIKKWNYLHPMLMTCKIPQFFVYCLKYEQNYKVLYPIEY